MYIPMTGTPVAGDTFNVVVPSPASRIVVEGVDAANAIAAPTFEFGSSGSSTTLGQSFPAVWNQSISFNNGGAATNSSTTNSAISPNSATAPGSISIGGTGNAAPSSYSATIGGDTTTASGFASAAFNSNTVASSLDADAFGANTVASGNFGFTGGSYSADRGNYARQCFAGGRFATTGDAQSCSEVLRGTGTSTTAIRLTADGATAGSANCINIPNNTAYLLTLNVQAFDHTTVANSASWTGLTSMLTRGASASTTTLNIASATPTATYSNGTTTGQSLSLTADTTNGCLNISYTPPTGNTDTWNIVASVVSIETQ